MISLRRPHNTPKYNVAFPPMHLNTLKHGTLTICGADTWPLIHGVSVSIHSACLRVTMMTVNSSSPSALSDHTSANSLPVRHPRGLFFRSANIIKQKTSMVNTVQGCQEMVYKVTLLTTHQETVTSAVLLGFDDFVSKNDTR